uniref:Secretory peptide n=1 Tax=Heteropoda venatoria TaxID=152925 RepID=A0A088BPH8_HETVE|nr:secretory peptide [Heteropoda venatoria]
MSYMYLILFCLVICSTVSTKDPLDPSEVQILFGESKREEGQWEITIIRDPDNPNEAIHITCDDEEDCRRKLDEAVEHIFMRFG